MINDNDLLLLASSQNKTFEVYIDSSGRKTLKPQTESYEARYREPYVCSHSSSNVSGLLANKNPKKVELPNCIEARGELGLFGAFESAFENCTSLTSVSFPALTTATGGLYNATCDGAFMSAFANCTSLTSVSFPALTTATGGSGNSVGMGAFMRAFEHCTSLTSVSFPALTKATGGSGNSVGMGAFMSAFANCTSLTSVSFPALTNVISNSDFDTFRGAFSGCSPSLKVHFKKSMKGTEGLDYEEMNLRRADQVVFDLP